MASLILSLALLGFEPAKKSCLSQKLKQVLCNNQTALRDAARQGIEMMVKLYTVFASENVHKQFKFIHIVLTDGVDNSSEISMNNFLIHTQLLRDKLPEDILKTIYIGVDIDNNDDALRELQRINNCGGDQTDLYAIDSDEIQQIFQKIQMDIGLQVERKGVQIQSNNMQLGMVQTQFKPVITMKLNKYVVLFTLDVSGSMRGNKWSQVCKSVDQFLGNLGEGDFVSGIIFNNRTAPLTHIDVSDWNEKSKPPEESQQNTILFQKVQQNGSAQQRIFIIRGGAPQASENSEVCKIF